MSGWGEKQRLQGRIFKYEALEKCQPSSLTTTSTDRKKPGLNDSDRRWCLVATLGWQRAPSGVMLYTESKEILCLPNKNRIQTPNRICFFCGLLVFCFFVVVFLFLFLLAKVRGNQQAAKRGKLWLQPARIKCETKEPLARAGSASCGTQRSHLKHQ